MGIGGYIKIYNATPLAFLKYGLNSYQMNAWDYPDRLGSNAADIEYIEFDTSAFKTISDDGGSAYFVLENNLQKLILGATADPAKTGGPRYMINYYSDWDIPRGEPLAEPYYIFWTTDDPVWRLLTKEERKIGFIHDGTIELKIVQINNYCSGDLHPLDVLDCVLNSRWTDPKFQKFIDILDQALARM